MVAYFYRYEIIFNIAIKFNLSMLLCDLKFANVNNESLNFLW